MFDQFRESVLRVAREEEERRARQSGSGQKKKKKKTKYQHLIVNGERTVLYDFDANPQYPEQVSVKSGDVVFVFESFEDGWSQVKKYSGNQGVIPTSFLGVVATAAVESSKSGGFSAQIKQRLKVLALMAVDQFKVKATSGAQSAVRGGKYIVTDVVVPAVKKVFLIASMNESYTTPLSSVVRRIYSSVCASLIPALSDEELAWYSAQLKEDSDKVKAEKARRLEASTVSS